MVARCFVLLGSFRDTLVRTGVLFPLRSIPDRPRGYSCHVVQRTESLRPIDQVSLQRSLHGCKMFVLLGSSDDKLVGTGVLVPLHSIPDRPRGYSCQVVQRTESLRPIDQVSLQRSLHSCKLFVLLGCLSSSCLSSCVLVPLYSIAGRPRVYSHHEVKEELYTFVHHHYHDWTSWKPQQQQLNCLDPQEHCC